MIGYKAIGLYDNLVQASEEMVKTGKEFSPDEAAVERYEEGYEFFKELVRKFSKLYSLHDSKYTSEN